VRKAALMLDEAGAIVDESARPAFSFEEAREVFAVLTHALIGAGLPDKVRDKLTALEHQFFDLRSLSSRSASARDAPEHAGFHRHSGARRQRLRREWARFFEHIDVVLCPPAPRDPSGYFDLMLWVCLATGAGLPAAVAPAMLGVDACRAACFEDRTAIACAAMLEALGASFRAPPMTSP
jgi:amidase